MNTKFSRNLNIILNISPTSTSAVVATRTIRELTEANEQIIILENRLQSAIKKLNGDLAINLRKSLPNINIAVESTKCKIGTTGRVIEIQPNFRTQSWVITPSITDKKIKITSDLNEIIETVTGHFDNSAGSGKLLIEGKTATLSQLMNWSTE